jgi:hypothetical protein
MSPAAGSWAGKRIGPAEGLLATTVWADARSGCVGRGDRSRPRNQPAARGLTHDVGQRGQIVLVA